MTSNVLSEITSAKWTGNDDLVLSLRNSSEYHWLSSLEFAGQMPFDRLIGHANQNMQMILNAMPASVAHQSASVSMVASSLVIGSLSLSLLFLAQLFP